MRGDVLLMDFSLPLKDPVPIFSLVLFIILLAPIVLRKLRIPSIIGLIIAGMAIGDHGFKIIEQGSIDLFGKAGLLYIMFLAGLELDMGEFRKTRNRSFVFGIFTFMVPLICGYLMCMYILQFNLMASLLVSSMFATHTLVAYPLVGRLGISKNEAVTVAVGGTIITDTAVLLILAVITAAQSGHLNSEFWIRLAISLTVFAVVVLWGFPLIGRWFFKKIKDDKTSHFIFVLALVFLAGFLAELAGVEAIIGAFLAGLALNQLIPHTSPLMNRIEFVGNAIFIPFFLISVGMIVDLRVLMKGPEALIIAGALTTMALFSKYLAAWLTQLCFGYTINQRHVIFGLSSAHAAATIAVILIGFNLGIINENVLNGTIVLILITCMVSSFVTESAGRKMAIIEADKVPETDNAIERILIPIANPDRMEALLDFALMVKMPGSTQPVHPLIIVQDDAEAKEKILVSTRITEKLVLHAAASESNVKVETRVDLNVTDGIARAVKELLVSDVVLAWSDKNKATDRIFGSFFGSTTDNILQSVWEQVFICNFKTPINTTKKLVLVLPRNAEYELGFGNTMRKVALLSKQVGARVLIYCDKKTRQAVQQALVKLKLSIEVTYELLEHLEDFLILSRKVGKNDLLMVVSARRGTISYQTYLENIPARLMRHFKQNNVILVYPEQRTAEITEPGMQDNDITLMPIQEQIQNINKLGRVVKRIFKNDKPGASFEEES
jgi:Kef-type K+ transport system membrane component KefB